jgi:hypothetical protein
VSAPAVSVVVPTYQRRELVKRAVASVLSQTFRDFELIVVDDGSTEGTGEALSRLEDRLRYVWQENRGVAAARNVGLGLARGSIVAFLDSDSRWLPDHLTTVTEALEQHPGAVLAFSPPDSRSRPLAGSGRARLSEPLPRLLVGNYVGNLSSVAVRRDALREVGGFDERLRLTEDADLWLRLAVRGGRFVSTSRRTVLRGVSDDSLFASRAPDEYVDALELSTEEAVGALERAGDDGMASRARGRRHLLRALRALNEGDDDGVRVGLAAACRLLPELSVSPDSVLNHVRFNLPAGATQSQRACHFTTVAASWPDRKSDAGRMLLAHALVEALTAGRPVQVWRVLRCVQPRSLPSLLNRARARRAGTAGEEASTLTRLIHRVMLQTGRGPLRPAWWLAHEALARIVASYLRGGDRETSAYVAGSVASGEPVYGLSDIDLVLVVGDREHGDAARRAVLRRWRRLRDALPTLAERMFEPPRVYGQAELRASSSDTTLTHGLRGVALEPSSRERSRELAGAERSRLYGPAHDWRLLAGRERRPQARSQDRDERRIAAWLELQFWWLQAFRACVEPRAPWTPYLCVKLLSEPARICLWLAHGERIDGRRELIDRAMRELPEEEEALRTARELLDALGTSPAAPLAETLQSFARMSRWIADRIQADLSSAPSSRVRLIKDGSDQLVVPSTSLAALRRAVGVDGPLDPLPLLDWRARVWSLPPDECFLPLSEKPLEPALMGAAAVACNDGAYAALRVDGLLVLPSLKRARLRGVQCAGSDPVSFALIDGSPTADFPEVPGWSARDSARRAVAEHLGWVRAEGDGAEDAKALGRLLTAARAALFLESVEQGSPELALTVASVADCLGGSLAREAVEGHRAFRLAGEPPPERLVSAFHAAVTSLPAYAGSG